MQDSPIISIVDDDKSVRVAMKNLIMRSDIGQTFALAKMFLQSARMADTACPILDVQMPGMGGLELQRVLLAQGQLLPFIFSAAKDCAMKVGAVCFLQKPFHGDGSLIRCVEAALKRVGGASEEG